MKGRLSCLTMCRNFHRRCLRFKHGTILPWYNTAPMLCLRFQLNRPRRATAWLLFLVCAWMGTGGALHHTEGESALRPASQAAAPLLSAARHHLAPVPSDTCAACEWTQGLLGRTLAVCRVSLPLLSSMPCSITLPALPAYTLRQRPSRAPPASSAFC